MFQCRMTVLLVALAAAATGGIISWLVLSSRLKWWYGRQAADIQMEHARQFGEAEARARSAEALVTELRQQAEERSSEAGRIRAELDSERQAKVEALTRLESAEKGFEEQKRLIEAMKKEMTDTFNALSAAALRSSSEDFLRLASESLGKVVADTRGRLGEHQAALDGMIKPLSDALKRYDEQIQKMEEGRHKAYGSLEEQLRTLAATHETLQRETSNLVSALRKPQVKGRWGEMQLRRVAELSGMSEHCDFTEQLSVDTEKGRVRPDMIVHLPTGREIVVDAKVSLEAYLDAVAVQTDEERRQRMERHTQQVRAHMNRLSSKEYWSQFSKSPEFVVLFIPGESFLSAALDIDPGLIEDGIGKRVIVATPTTFIALLRAIAYGWRQEQVTRNAQQISGLGRELYERVRTMARHFEDLGAAIAKSMDSYNRAVGSLESRVLPSMRKFRELGVTGAEEIPPLEQIDRSPRSLNLLPDDPAGK